MTNEDLQGAFQSIHASEGLLKEVLTMEDQKKRTPFGWRPVLRWVTAVAVAVVILFGALVFWPEGGDPSQPGIIAIPGVMKAYAYEVKDNKSVDFSKLGEYTFVENRIKPGQSIWNPFSNYELAITPVVNEANLQDYTITFEVTTKYGIIVGNYHNREKYKSYTDAVMGKCATIENGETLYWEGYEPNTGGDFLYTYTDPGEDTIYVDLVIRADTHIIGYAIFEIVPVEGWDGLAYTGMLVYSAYYPMVDGQFQAVTEAFVLQEIENFKNN